MLYHTQEKHYAVCDATLALGVEQMKLTQSVTALQRYSVTGCNACNACNGVTLVTPNHKKRATQGNSLILKLHAGAETAVYYA